MQASTQNHHDNSFRLLHSHTTTSITTTSCSIALFHRLLTPLHRSSPAMSRPDCGVFTFLIGVCMATVAVVAQKDGCGADLGAFLPSPFNASGLSCRPVRNSFILRYSQSQDNTLSIVLSAVYTSGWVGIGFSDDGTMVGSSAMVGWIDKEGRAYIKQYYLSGRTSSEVTVNEGKLRATGVPPAVVLYGDNIYLVFQVKFAALVAQQLLILAISTRSPNKFRLTGHDDKTAISFDFSSGDSAAATYPDHLKRNHGALAMFGWGVLLPSGAIVARYLRHKDPLWYYLHILIQFAGYIMGLAGVVAGIALYNRIQSSLTVHRGLGISILVLGSLQVIAYFVRPSKDSKIRKYWNWYHHWVGRLALFLAAINIALGVQIGGDDVSWKAIYGAILAVILIAVTLLEIMMWARLQPKESISPPGF